MSDWIKMEIDLPDHPKVREMAHMLGIDRDAVIGKLLRVWGWMNRQSAGGFVPHTVDADIDDLARHQGFANAMASVDWLEIDAERHAVRMSNFQNHNGFSKRDRMLSAKRSNRYRSRKRLATKESGHAESSRYTSRQRHASTVTNVTPREEKRRVKQEQELPAAANAATGVISQGNDLLGPEPDKPQKTVIPVQAVVALYHEVLPELPKVEKLTKTRIGYIRQRWLDGDLSSLDEWRNYFTFVRGSPFLMGRKPGTGDKPPFRASLEWLCRPSNYAKVAEENYHHDKVQKRS